MAGIQWVLSCVIVELIAFWPNDNDQMEHPPSMIKLSSFFGSAGGIHGELPPSKFNASSIVCLHFNCSFRFKLLAVNTIPCLWLHRPNTKLMKFW